MRAFPLRRRFTIPLALIVVVSLLKVSLAANPADIAPPFKLRARVLAVAGEKPQGKKFQISVGGLAQKEDLRETVGDQWSEWIQLDKARLMQALRSHPQHIMHYGAMLPLHVRSEKYPLKVAVEVDVEGAAKPVELAAELDGANLIIALADTGEGKLLVTTQANFNDRYFYCLAPLKHDLSKMPKKFPVVDRFIAGDSDRLNWEYGIKNLQAAGFNAIMLPPQAPVRDALLKNGGQRTAWAVYSPPGAFAFQPNMTPAALKAWAHQQSDPYVKAGYAPKDMAMFAMADEPGWYYPAALEQLKATPEGLARFRDFLKAQGLAPKDVGAASWDTVMPVGVSAAKDLPGKILFYWTMRFFPYDSAQLYANCTKALEETFYPGMPIFTNWNFFSGRSYVPGPVANNRDRGSPDAAMGGHDWLEFGRLRGGTMLWTEDWFPDYQAFQWSFYCAKLRSAAAKSGVEFGGYIVPRKAGDRTAGVQQKILTIIGSGGKGLKYFTFGPEYTFPGNCYSDRAPLVLPRMAEAHAMIGAAESLLWPGRRPQPTVAILSPKSAQFWDPNGISDATNVNLNGATMDYLAEVFDLYVALQHANIPVDFVEEEDLSPAGLKNYHALYVTTPNVPRTGQKGIADWVRGGGTLVTVSGAAQADRYNEPCTVLADAIGIHETPRPRLYVGNAGALPVAEHGAGKGPQGAFSAVGPRGQVKATDVDAVAKFDDGTPAIVRRQVGKGVAVHFAWLPGISYWKNLGGRTNTTEPPDVATIRQWITWPLGLNPARPHTTPASVDQPYIETPVLVSDAGAAVTMLNWVNLGVDKSYDKLGVTLRLPFEVKSIESIKQGKLTFEQADGVVKLTMRFGAYDILMVHAKGK